MTTNLEGGGGVALLRFGINQTRALWHLAQAQLTSSQIWIVMVHIGINYIPSWLYAYLFIKKIYVTARQKRMEQQVKIDEIIRQIEIVDMREVMNEEEKVLLAQQLKEQMKLLREARERYHRARRLILKEPLVPSLDNDAVVATEADKDDLPKELAREPIAGDRSPRASSSSGDSLYSSLSDTGCQHQIIRVTRLIRITKYVKQKQLRRHTKQALLKKKKENVKKILEDWKRYLNIVINQKLSTLTVGPTSYAAMGDYSNFRDLSDSGSDIRDNGDGYVSAPVLQHPVCFEDTPVTMESGDSGDSGDYADQRHVAMHRLDDVPAEAAMLFTLQEETNSQIEMDEINAKYC